MRPSIVVDEKRYYILDPITAFPEGAGRRYEVEGKELAVFRLTDERFFAVENKCPHQGGMLCRGSIKNVCQVSCPNHGWTFDLGTGKNVQDTGDDIQSFPVVIKDGVAYVCVDLPENEKTAPEMAAFNV